MRCKKTGFYWVEAMPITNGALPGTQEEENWTPYKLWAGDLFECEGCGTQTISGVPNGPVAEHYQEDFEGWIRKLAPVLQVNDC